MSDRQPVDDDLLAMLLPVLRYAAQNGIVGCPGCDVGLLGCEVCEGDGWVAPGRFDPDIEDHLYEAMVLLDGAAPTHPKVRDLAARAGYDHEPGDLADGPLLHALPNGAS